MNKLDNSLKELIISRLTSNFDISNIILFGSYAYGNPTESSDLDMVVVLNQNDTANSYEEMLKRRLSISSLFLDIKKKIGMDILVYTINEWNKLVSLDSSFIREINTKGVILK